MTALNNDTRQYICRAVLAHAFTDEVTQHAKNHVDVAERVARHHFGDDLDTMRALVEKYPENFQSCTAIDLNVNGERHRVGHSTLAGGIYEHFGYDFKIDVDSEPLPSSRYGNLSITLTDKEKELVDAVRNLSDAGVEMFERIANRHSEIHAVLNSVRTFSQLEKTWPEIMPIARQFIPENKRRQTLPDVQRKKLNSLLDLPPEQKEAA